MQNLNNHAQYIRAKRPRQNPNLVDDAKSHLSEVVGSSVDVLDKTQIWSTTLNHISLKLLDHLLMFHFHPNEATLVRNVWRTIFPSMLCPLKFFPSMRSQHLRFQPCLPSTFKINQRFRSLWHLFSPYN